jgi:hypothetical protein
MADGTIDYVGIVLRGLSLFKLFPDSEVIGGSQV